MTFGRLRRRSRSGGPWFGVLGEYSPKSGNLRKGRRILGLAPHRFPCRWSLVCKTFLCELSNLEIG